MQWQKRVASGRSCWWRELFPGNVVTHDLEMFRSSYFADISLNQWMALTTPKLVEDHLNLDARTIAALCKGKPVLTAG